MAAELHALVAGFENAIIVREMTSEILGREIPIDVYIDSKTVFDLATRLSSTLEKRLQTDAFAVQESHLRGELSVLFWIPSHQNCADSLTKSGFQGDGALQRLMRTNRLQVEPTGWVHQMQARDEVRDDLPDDIASFTKEKFLSVVQLCDPK